MRLIAFKPARCEWAIIIKHSYRLMESFVPELNIKTRRQWTRGGFVVTYCCPHFVSIWIYGTKFQMNQVSPSICSLPSCTLICPHPVPNYTPISYLQLHIPVPPYFCAPPPSQRWAPSPPHIHVPLCLCTPPNRCLCTLSYNCQPATLLPSQHVPSPPNPAPSHLNLCANWPSHHHAPSPLTPIPLRFHLYAPHLPTTMYLHLLFLCIFTPHPIHLLLSTSMHPLKPSCVVWINHDNMTDRCFVQITLCTKNLWLHQLKQNYTVIDRYVSCYPLGKNDVIFLETLVSVSDPFLTSIAFAAIKLRSILLCTDGLHWRCEINRAWANPAIIKDSYILVKRCSNSIFAEQNWKVFLVLSWAAQAYCFLSWNWLGTEDLYLILQVAAVSKEQLKITWCRLIFGTKYFIFNMNFMKRLSFP